MRCTPDRLASLGQFYVEVLGLRIGPRPDFDFDGLWLYGSGGPVVHLAATIGKPSSAEVEHIEQPGFDHVAFRAQRAREFKGRLQRLRVAFREQQVPQGPYQIFVHDPEGTALEFNFAASE